MNFGDFLDSSQGGGGGGGLRLVGDIAYSNSLPTQQHLVSHSLDKPTMHFNTPGLSLALTSLEGQGEMARMGGNYGSNHNSTSTVSLVRSRDDEHESRSGSDHMEGASGDELDATDGRPPKKKRYHRHTPQQIQELESLFKKCPHPDDKQRLELSRRLCLDPRQVKFWFQNRRTQMKTQLERHENSILRQENEKLRVENMSIREAMRNPICTNCGGPAMIGDISFEGQHLRIENARLKDELDRVCALTGKFLGRPISSLPGSMGPPMPNSCLELGVGSNGFTGFSNLPTSLPLGLHDFNIGISSAVPVMSQNRATSEPSGIERTMYLDLALAAMGELFRMAQTDDPLWIRNSECGREILNYDEYTRTFSPCIGMKPNGFVSEASRDTGSVIINSLALVETLMDSNKWADMFPCIISRSSMTDVISSGMGGTRNGALHLMHAELQALSPLVPVREVNFLRFCKQHAEGVWAVVDVTIDTIREPSTSGAPTYISCRRLPSGCVVQDMTNGYAKVTWVEHAEYDESLVHQLYRPLISAGMGFGAQRWVAALQRQCECLALLMSCTLPSGDQSDAITPAGRRSMLKLARRMTDNFCAGVSASKVYKWNKLNAGNVDENVRVMTRESVNDPGEPSGIVLSAATSVWLPISPRKLFNFLRDEGLRSEWDILSNGGPMQEMARIAKGQDHGNSVSLLRATAMNSNQNSMLILQETNSDASGSVVVYAPVDIPAMHVVMNGGDSDYVALLPSGFAIVPDGPGSGVGGPVSNGDMIHGGPMRGRGGSLLTVGFQILVNSLPTGKLTVESVETLNNLISCTVQKIKAALNCET